jgi:hypothetical protein
MNSKLQEVGGSVADMPVRSRVLTVPSNVPTDVAPTATIGSPLHTVGELEITPWGSRRLKLTAYGEMVLVGLALIIPLSLYALGLGGTGRGFHHLVGALVGFCVVYIATRTLLVWRHRRRRRKPVH